MIVFAYVEVCCVAARRCREWKWRYLPRSVRVWVTRRAYAVLFITRHGYTIRGVCLPFLSGDAGPQRGEIMRTIWGCQAMKRKDPKKVKTLATHASSDGLKEWPSLCEWLTAARFEGSEERRESPTLTIWCAGGQWRASLKDRAEGLVMWLSAATLPELAQLAELLCLSPEGPWRHDEQSHERNGKRVKKS